MTEILTSEDGLTCMKGPWRIQIIYRWRSAANRAMKSAIFF